MNRIATVRRPHSIIGMRLLSDRTANQNTISVWGLIFKIHFLGSLKAETTDAALSRVVLRQRKLGISW